MTTREKRLAGVAFTMALLWAGTTFGVRPLLSTRRATAVAIENAEFELAQARHTVANSEKVERELKRVRAAAARLQTRLLPGEEAGIAGAELGKIVNHLSTQVDAELKSNKARDPIPAEALTVIPTEIHLDMTIEKLTELLYRIETHQKELRVPKIIVRQQKPRSPEEKLDVRMTIAGYAASPEMEERP
jgi:hypothetical protein